MASVRLPLLGESQTLLHAESMLLIDDHQREIGEARGYAKAMAEVRAALSTTYHVGMSDSEARAKYERAIERVWALAKGGA